MAKMISRPLTTIMLLLVAFSAITSTIEAICSDAMAISLSASGFTIFAHALHAHNVTATTRLTFLAPPDTTLNGRPLDADSLTRHVSVAGALPYQSLVTLPAGTSLPTLHHNATLLVGTDGESVSFNGVLVAVPNLYLDGSCAVHGVEGPLVPIPSTGDNLDLSPPARNAISPSPATSQRRKTRAFSQRVRFIRRANRPVFADESDRKP